MTLDAAAAHAGYDLVNLAARGSRGSIYRADERATGERVALKVLDPDTQFDDLARRCGALSTLNHPHVMTVRCAVLLHEEPAIVADWIDGITLDELWLRRSTLSEARSETILSGILDGLEAMHDAGIAHGSLSSHNILIGDDDHVTLIDLDLATGSSNDPAERVSLDADLVALGALARLVFEEHAVNPAPAWRRQAIDGTEDRRFSSIADIRTAMLPSRRERIQLERDGEERRSFILPALVGLGVVLLTIGVFTLFGPDDSPAPAPTITGVEDSGQP